MFKCSLSLIEYFLNKIGYLSRIELVAQSIPFDLERIQFTLDSVQLEVEAVDMHVRGKFPRSAEKKTSSNDVRKRSIVCQFLGGQVY